MKTSEFIQRVEAMGYLVKENVTEETLLVRVNKNYDEYTIATVYRDEVYQIDTGWDDGVDGDLFDLIVEYAKTPIVDREEPKLFYVKHKHFVEGANCLNFSTECAKYFAGAKISSWSHQTQFTQEQIEQIPWELGDEWEVVPID